MYYSIKNIPSCNVGIKKIPIHTSIHTKVLRSIKSTGFFVENKSDAVFPSKKIGRKLRLETSIHSIIVYVPVYHKHSRYVFVLPTNLAVPLSSLFIIDTFIST